MYTLLPYYIVLITIIFIRPFVGAVREHWRSAIRQKLSKSRAEERKALEERRKWYSEEVGGASDEEEAELTGMSINNSTNKILCMIPYGECFDLEICMYKCFDPLVKECFDLRW